MLFFSKHVSMRRNVLHAWISRREFDRPKRRFQEQSITELVTDQCGMRKENKVEIKLCKDIYQGRDLSVAVKEIVGKSPCHE